MPPPHLLGLFCQWRLIDKNFLAKFTLFLSAGEAREIIYFKRRSNQGLGGRCLLGRALAGRVPDNISSFFWLCFKRRGIGSRTSTSIEARIRRRLKSELTDLIVERRSRRLMNRLINTFELRRRGLDVHYN